MSQSDCPKPSWTAELEASADTLEALGWELIHHQASVQLDYLYDHGWQVGLHSPGGSLFVHACEGPDKWPKDGGPSLSDTIRKAIDKAKSAGWW